MLDGNCHHGNAPGACKQCYPDTSSTRPQMGDEEKTPWTVTPFHDGYNVHEGTQLVGWFADRALAQQIADENNNGLRRVSSVGGEPLCEDEGCPHHGKPHVCVSTPDTPSARPQMGDFVLIETLRWWRQLVDANPQDLAPRLDAAIERASLPQHAQSGLVEAKPLSENARLLLDGGLSNIGKTYQAVHEVDDERVRIVGFSIPENAMPMSAMLDALREIKEAALSHAPSQPAPRCQATLPADPPIDCQAPDCPCASQPVLQFDDGTNHPEYGQ